MTQPGAEDRSDVPAAIAGDEIPEERRRRRLFLGIWGAVFVAVVLAFRSVMLPFLLAVILAFVLAPLVEAIERIRVGKRAIPRWVAVVALYVALLGLLGGLSAVGTPRLVSEVRHLAQDLPETVARFKAESIPKIEKFIRDITGSPEVAPPVASSAAEEGHAHEPEGIRVEPTRDGGYTVRLPRDGVVVAPEGRGYRVRTATRHTESDEDVAVALVRSLRGLADSGSEQAAAAFRAVRVVAEAIVRGIFTFFLVLMLSAYMLITSDRIFAFLRSLVRPARQAGFDMLLKRIDRGLAGVVRGQLVICVVNGVLSGIGFYLLDLRYWPILTLIATVLSIIPIFGAILSSIPAVAIGLQASFATGLMALGWILIIHQIEANLLNPKIMGDAAKVHPVLVVFALLAGEHFFGIAGALLAVPALSIAQSLFLHHRQYALGNLAPRDSLVP